MPRTSIRSLARSLVATESALETADPPEPEQLDSGGETTGRSAATVEVEEVDSSRAASAGSEHPAPREGDKALEGPDWRKEFDSPDELYRRFKDVDRVRGRHASEVGLLRRQVRLYERTIRLLLLTRDPFERQALIQAAGLLHEPRAQPSVERLVTLGEAHHEQENRYAV
jgi:hypothetical protein